VLVGEFKTFEYGTWSRSPIACVVFNSVANVNVGVSAGTPHCHVDRSQIDDTFWIAVFWLHA
jgi:hypothetical protein